MTEDKIEFYLTNPEYYLFVDLHQNACIRSFNENPLETKKDFIIPNVFLTKSLFLMNYREKYIFENYKGDFHIKNDKGIYVLSYKGEDIFEKYTLFFDWIFIRPDEKILDLCFEHKEKEFVPKLQDFLRYVYADQARTRKFLYNQ